MSVQQKQKEISIRKVLGADLAQLLLLLNQNFIKLVLCSFILATPLAYYFLENWLSNFALRIEMGVFVFAIPLFLTLVLAVTIVSIQSFGTVNANPVDTLRNE